MMEIRELWRYPVKSLAGEPLDEVEVLVEGLTGDRLIHVRNSSMRVITSRTHPRLLALHGTRAADGTTLIDGRPWDSEESHEAIRDAAGSDAKPFAYGGPERFDVLPLSIATDGAIAALAVDRRRLRPNIVVAGVDGLGERSWVGRRLRIGDALISVVRLRPRCVMTTYDPDTQEQDHSVLRRIVQDFDGVMSLDCSIIRPGRMKVGDVVEVVE